MSKVFISYRREDAAGYAQHIFGQLEKFLRRDQIFMDVDTIPPGVDFVTHIEQAVSECDVLIALIGKRWSGEREKATPRIHDPHDFVHLEIATALARDIRVIPVLVDGASLPNKDRLPRTLQPLVRRNALELSHTRFRFDLERISEAVQKTIGPPNVKIRAAKQSQQRMLYGGLILALIISLGLVVNLWVKGAGEKQSETIKPDPPPSNKKAPVFEKEQAPSRSSPSPQSSVDPKPKTPITDQQATDLPLLSTWKIQGDVVIDESTNLMWTRGDFKTLTGRFANSWDDAMRWANEMNAKRYGGYSDWQVASIAEYRTIHKPSMRTVFSSDHEDYYWSRNEINKYVASYFDFSDGSATSTTKAGYRPDHDTNRRKFSARLVRRID